jgi:hypothetical protein
MEPLYVDRGYRGNQSEVANKLIDDMFEFCGNCDIRGFISIADDPIAEQICIARGMKQIASPVYIKL